MISDFLKLFAPFLLPILLVAALIAVLALVVLARWRSWRAL
jgi:hypothetical protein